MKNDEGVVSPHCQDTPVGGVGHRGHRSVAGDVAAVGGARLRPGCTGAMQSVRSASKEAWNTYTY